MATRGPSKARELNYSNVGTAGRRTGITLKEGRLDEHGMEEIDGMFSSPEKEKSPVKANGTVTTNDISLHSESMETGGSSSIPEPADLLSSSRGARHSFLMPPRSRSPIKTNMSGSPRRTPGIRSSPAPQSDLLSSPTSSRQPTKRTLDFSTTEPQTRSPLSAVRSRSSPPGSRPNGTTRGRGVAAESDEGENADFSDDGNHLLEEEEDQDTAFAEPPGDYHESADIAESVENDEDYGDAGYPEEDPGDEQPSPSVAASASKRGRKRNSGAVEANPGNQNKRGRKPKTAGDEGPGQRPAKKARTAKQKTQEGNISLSADQQKDLDRVVDNYTQRNGPLDKHRSLHILRRETPTDDSVKHTRSGRVSVRPLAYWRNERFVYGNENDVEVGQRFPVSTIKEIIRADEPETEGGKRGKRSTKKKSKSKSKSRRGNDDASDDDSGEDAEPWETEGGGVFVGPVKIWDPETQTGTAEEEMMDIGYAPHAIQTHEVKNSTFRFAKILSTPFIGSGIVEMPPGAVKKQKNSKRMHMVFFVYHGRVHVEIAGLTFSAGKGCVFQVPRGNNYGFENNYDKPATIFFTQGCIPLDSEGNVDTTVTAPPLPDPATSQPEDPAPAKAGKKPAKKKGRQKQAS